MGSSRYRNFLGDKKHIICTAAFDHLFLGPCPPPPLPTYLSPLDPLDPTLTLSSCTPSFFSLVISISSFFYCPPTKLQEGNVFSHVCPSGILSTGSPCTRPPPNNYVQGPDPTDPTDIFNMKHGLQKSGRLAFH